MMSFRFYSRRTKKTQSIAPACVVMVTLICARDCRKASDIQAPLKESHRNHGHTMNETGGARSETRGRGGLDDGAQDGGVYDHMQSKYSRQARPALDEETQRNRVPTNTTFKFQSLERFSKASRI